MILYTIYSLGFLGMMALFVAPSPEEGDHSFYDFALRNVRAWWKAYRAYSAVEVEPLPSVAYDYWPLAHLRPAPAWWSAYCRGDLAKPKAEYDHRKWTDLHSVMYEMFDDVTGTQHTVRVPNFMAVA